MLSFAPPLFLVEDAIFGGVWRRMILETRMIFLFACTYILNPRPNTPFYRPCNHCSIHRPQYFRLRVSLDADTPYYLSESNEYKLREIEWSYGDKIKHHKTLGVICTRRPVECAEKRRCGPKPLLKSSCSSTYR